MNKLVSLEISANLDRHNVHLPTDLIARSQKKLPIIPNSIMSQIPHELSRYRLPNLMESFAKRIALEKIQKDFPDLPHMRVIIADFSKNPTMKQRLLDSPAYAYNLLKDKNTKRSKALKKMKFMARMHVRSPKPNEPDLSASQISVGSLSNTISRASISKSRASFGKHSASRTSISRTSISRTSVSRSSISKPTTPEASRGSISVNDNKRTSIRLSVTIADDEYVAPPKQLGRRGSMVSGSNMSIQSSFRDSAASLDSDGIYKSYGSALDLSDLHSNFGSSSSMASNVVNNVPDRIRASLSQAGDEIPSSFKRDSLSIARKTSNHGFPTESIRKISSILNSKKIPSHQFENAIEIPEDNSSCNQTHYNIQSQEGSFKRDSLSIASKPSNPGFPRESIRKISSILNSKKIPSHQFENSIEIPEDNSSCNQTHYNIQSQESLQSRESALPNKPKKRALKPTKGVLRDFTKNYDCVCKSSSQMQQENEIQKIFKQLEKHSIDIPKDVIRKGLMLPEEVVLGPEKMSPAIKESIRFRQLHRPANPENQSGIPRRLSLYSSPTLKSSSFSNSSFSGPTSVSTSVATSSPLTTPTHNPRSNSIYAQLKTKEDSLIFTKVKEGSKVTETVLPEPIKRKAPKVNQPGLKKKHHVAIGKMIIKPEEDTRYDSDGGLYKKPKAKINCWWSPYEYSQLKKGFMKWKIQREDEKARMQYDILNKNPAFRSQIPNRLSTPETANKTTKYLKQLPSIDQISIEPQSTKEFVEYVQSVSQGKEYFRGKSHWTPTGRPNSSRSRGTEAMDNMTNISRTRSLSHGNQPPSHMPEALRNILSKRPASEFSSNGGSGFYLQSMIKQKGFID